MALAAAKPNSVTGGDFLPGCTRTIPNSCSLPSWHNALLHVGSSDSALAFVYTVVRSPDGQLPHRMPPKRKTKDAPSPSRPAVSRARTTRASKASPAADGNDQESDALPRRPAKKARKAGPKAAWLDEDLDDDFEKPGR